MATCPKLAESAPLPYEARMAARGLSNCMLDNQTTSIRWINSQTI